MWMLTAKHRLSQSAGKSHFRQLPVTVKGKGVTFVVAHNDQQRFIISAVTADRHD